MKKTLLLTLLIMLFTLGVTLAEDAPPEDEVPELFDTRTVNTIEDPEPEPEPSE